MDNRDREKAGASPRASGYEVAQTGDREKDIQTLEDNAFVGPTQGLLEGKESDDQNKRKGQATGHEKEGGKVERESK